ncbi:T-cell surface glycoprotein CD3 zeta chain [Grus japonensis]|uniref:T-cell surface glycoprotein CD3 zeta chain n=1 Tax=Grus japonensis TaxID=30415 RepID=A0ABC9VYE6_GRUJA
MAEITSRSPGQGDDVLLLVPHRLFGGVVSQDCKASAEPRGVEGGMFGGNEQNLLSQASEPQLQPGQDDVYNKLSRGPRDEYDVLGAKRGADPEMGGRHQSLQKDKMGDAYSEIGMKGEGLSTATKDTYDALQMQPLPPR